MKVAFVTLFICSSVFLLFIGSTRSQPNSRRPLHVTLENLYPNSDGVHFPHIERLNHPKTLRSLPNFRELRGQLQVKAVSNYLKRGDYIFAYEEENVIKLLSGMFDPILKIYPVFNTKIYEWYTMSLGDLHKLGVGRCLEYVLALEKAHAAEPESNHPVNSKAHNAARTEAYTKTRNFEKTLGPIPKFIDEDVVDSITNHYRRTYNEEYANHAGESSSTLISKMNHLKIADT